MIPTTERSRTAFLHDAEQEAVRTICNPRVRQYSSSASQPEFKEQVKCMNVGPQQETLLDQLIDTLFSAWPEEDPQPIRSSLNSIESSEVWTDSNLAQLCRHIASFLRRPPSFDKAMIGTGILLSRMWTVATLPADQSIPIMIFTAVMLLVVVHCPLKAAGMLNQVRGILETKRSVLSLRRLQALTVDSKSNAWFPITTMLQYVLEW